MSKTNSFHNRLYVLLSFVYVLFSVGYALFSLCYTLFSFGYALFSFGFALFPLFALFMRSLYSLFSCALCCGSFYALLYVLFLCAVLMCSFHKRQVILLMYKKYYCTKANMTDNKMNDVLKKLGLADYRAKFVEEKISTDIVCYLFIDFLTLGLADRNAIMSLRIECSTFGLCTPQRAVGTNKFVIPKILIDNLIDDGFSVKEMSNILCVSERTVLRRMVEYGSKIRDFSNISDDQLDSHVLALTNEYTFCDEAILRELLKGRGIIIQRYRFRDSMHRVSEVGI